MRSCPSSSRPRRTRDTETVSSRNCRSCRSQAARPASSARSRARRLSIQTKIPAAMRTIPAASHMRDELWQACRMRFAAVALLLWPLFWPMLAAGQGDAGAEMRKLAWQAGPLDARIADKATIKVPPGHVFLDAPNTRRFLELAGNPPRDGHYLFAPQSLSWFAVF